MFFFLYFWRLVSCFGRSGCPNGHKVEKAWILKDVSSRMRLFEDSSSGSRTTPSFLEVLLLGKVSPRPPPGRAPGAIRQCGRMFREGRYFLVKKREKTGMWEIAFPSCGRSKAGSRVLPGGSFWGPFWLMFGPRDPFGAVFAGFLDLLCRRSFLEGNFVGLGVVREGPTCRIVW